MTAQADIWAPHLNPGERLVWSADADMTVRRAELTRQRVIYGVTGLASLVIALLLGVRFIDSLIIVTATPSILAAFTPLFLVFALTMAALALWGFRRMATRPPVATHFAATDARLIALDASGAIIDQMPGAEIDNVVAAGRRRTPDVYVLRKDDPKEEHVFAIEHINRPLEAKALIEETFLPDSSSEEATA